MTDKTETFDQLDEFYAEPEKAVSLRYKGITTIDDRTYMIVSTELENGKYVESYIPATFDDFKVDLKGDTPTIKYPKETVINKGFSLKGYEGIVFNIKLKQCSQSKTSNGCVYVKLGIRFKNKYISYQEFQKAFNKLQKLLLTYKVPYQQTTLVDYFLSKGITVVGHYTDLNDALHYSFNKEDSDEKSISLEYKENQFGLIDKDSVNMLIPGCYRLDGESGLWVIDANLVYNIVQDILTSSEDFIVFS